RVFEPRDYDQFHVALRRHLPSNSGQSVGTGLKKRFRRRGRDSGNPSRGRRWQGSLEVVGFWWFPSITVVVVGPINVDFERKSLSDTLRKCRIDAGACPGFSGASRWSDACWARW